MKKNKILMKIITLTIVIAMIFTTAASAVTFTDISNHWAKDYILKVASNGLVTGYKDGTFKPENNVTILESLIMMSRLYSIDDDIKEQIVDKYTPIIENMTNNNDYEWAYEGLSIALELGIVSENGLKNMFSEKTISSNASKQVVAILLTKAMMMEGELKKTYVLPFNDALQISVEAKPYVYLMYSKAIITGDNKNNINPKSDITRAVIATMMDRAYSYIKENEIVPAFDGYKHTTSINGIVTEVTAGDIESYIYIKENDGDTSVIRTNDDTNIYLNDTTSSISKIKAGMTVTCKIDDQRIALSVNADNQTEIVNGTISYVAYSAPAKITIIDENDDEVTYDVPSDNMKVYLDGKETVLKNLKVKDLISLRIKSGVLYQIDSTSRMQTYEGKISAIDYSDVPIKLTILTTDNKSMTFEYSSDVEVTRNDDASSFDQIRVGDSVKVTAEYGKMTKINTVAAEAELSGTIKEILIASVNKIKIADDAGNVKEYPVSSNVQINIGSKNATIYDLRLGYQVDVNTSGDQIVTIEASEIQTAKSFSGKVVYINADDKLIMMQNIKENGQKELIYLRLTNSTKMFDISGATKYLKDMAEGDIIMSTAVSQGGEYVAVSIMIQ